MLRWKEKETLIKMKIFYLNSLLSQFVLVFLIFSKTPNPHFLSYQAVFTRVNLGLSLVA